MIGGIFTFMIIAVMVTYGSIKMSQMIERKSPLVAVYTEENAFDFSEQLYLN